MELIALDRLTKRFGSFTAVDDVSFTVNKGEVLGFLGPNGAGKSTTMKMVAGFLTPTAGTARIAGHDVQTDGIAAKRALGYLPEGAPAYPDMTPAGFLDFIAAIRGYDGAERAGRIAGAVHRADIGDVLHQPIDTLSKGFRRRVGLAQALIHDPAVLVLDEPTDGLDPNQKFEVRALIEAMAAEKAIIVSTHILEEVEAICTRAVIIAHGRVLADGTPAELAARDPDHNAVSLTVAPSDMEKVRGELGGLSGVAEVIEHKVGHQPGLLVRVAPGAAQGRNLVGDIGELARIKGWPVGEIRLEHGRLDTVFRTITRKPSAADPAAAAAA